MDRKTGYNHRDIMQTAWARTRGMMRSYAASQLREVVAYCLRQVWASDKAAARDAAMTVEQVQRQILCIETKTFTSREDRLRLRELRRLLSTKRERARQDAKRALIEEAGSQFVAVTFVKQDGSLLT